MKKFLLALAGMAAITGSASAADMAGHPYAKAPVPVMAAPSWTGLYIFGGAGGGLWAADTTTVEATGCILCGNQRQGGSGWFGTVGAGYDWQFSTSWVAGIFADGQFGSIKGTIQDQQPFAAGETKLRDSWAAGVRVGYLVAPNVLSYVNAGYTGSNWSGSAFFDTRTGRAAAFHSDGFDRTGWFIGGGVENNLNIFGISAPGWFMKTEYRTAFFDQTNIAELSNATGAPTGTSITFKPWVQTISTSLVYRFNWSGVPMASKY